jgi:alkaline phosphatase
MRYCFKKWSFRGISAIFLALVLVSGALAGEAKYVFLLIGDGMALPQRNAAEMYLGALQNKEGEPCIIKLAMDELPAQGMCTTYSTNSLITDSAAAGTALATGKKTKSGVISMNPSATESHKTIAEMARDKGMHVGIVSSVSIEHATPAVFYAHNSSRKNYYDLACQLAKSGFDYFGGGGFTQPRGKKGDQKSVFDILQEEGYRVADTREEFLALQPGTKAVAINPVLDGSKALPYDMDRDGKGMNLAEFTAKGIELLDNPKGFFMMVEGGKIDWACHANDAVASIMDTLAFDDAVKVVLDFYRQHPEDTLVVVTGDHETGGLTLGFAGTKYETYFLELQGQKSSYEVFDATLDAYRKAHSGADAPAPVFEDMIPLVKDVFGLSILSDSERTELEKKAAEGDEDAEHLLSGALKSFEVRDLKEAFEASMKGEKVGSSNEEEYLLYGGYEPFSVTLTHILNKKAGLAWTSYSHTGVPVPVSAIGAGADSFNGYYDNTDIFLKMVSLMNL